MKNPEIVKGDRRLGLFEQLQRDRTTIDMHLLGKDYERLTLITRTRMQNETPYFLVDYPEGFKEAVADVGVWKIRFECIGKDNIFYIFKTSGGEILKDEICIRFPEIIERIQRRTSFRLEPPLGTRIHVIINSTKHEMTVTNVSQGGALVSFKKGATKKPILQAGEHLRGLGLVFPSDEEVLKVNIKKASVKRLEKDPLTNRYRYGLQFIDIEKNDRDTLIDLIFRFQRELLRKRRLLGD